MTLYGAYMALLWKYIRYQEFQAPIASMIIYWLNS